VLDHQVDDLIVGQIFFAEFQRLVNLFFRSQQRTRRNAHLTQQLTELRLRNRIGVVVHGLEVDARLAQGRVHLTTGRACRLLVNSDFHN
jgi:hypothetical protein